MTAVWVFLVAVAGGVALAVQAPLNASLGRSLGAVLPAAALSFGIGFVVLTGLSLVSLSSPFARLASVPPWQWAGGLLGAFYVWSVIWGVPRLGVVSLMAAMLLGQLSAGLLLDAIGAFGLPVKPISPARLAAVGLVAAGLVLSRL